MTINAANYDLLNDFDFPNSSGVPTTVGTNGRSSFFGTYDQTGNIYEYTEKSVLLSASDKFSPITTPSGENVFISSANKSEIQHWPEQYVIPKTESLGPIPQSSNTVPSGQLFTYAKEARGGSFVSSSGDISAESHVKYVLPSDHSKTVGFRIGSIKKEITLTDVHSFSAASASILVSVSGASGIIPDMSVISSDFNSDIKVVGIDTTITSSGGVDYQYVNLSSVAGLSKGNITASFVLSNPVNIKNMLEINQSENSADTSGYGSVDEDYYIGKYPVTNSEYTAYLNIVARYDDDGSFYTPAKNSSNLGMAIGINRSKDKPYAYTAVEHMDDKPVVNITWIQAARYCNWLHNSHNNTSTLNTNTGAYNLSSPLNNITRSTNAKYFIPSVDEWYKSAYYDKTGGTFVYRKYATRTNSVPLSISEVNKYGDGPYKNLTDISLFDRFRFDKISNTRWTSLLNRAADRWDRYVSLVQYSRVEDTDSHDGYFLQVRNDNRYQQCKEYYENTYNRPWRGLYLRGFNPVNYSTETWITSCDIKDYAITNDGTERWMPLVFDMNINLKYNADYTDDEWVDIITHELGHALGIGTLWNKLPSDPNAVEENYYLNRNPFLKTNIEYNRVAYGVESGYNRLYTPIEQSAGNRIESYHWEDNYIPSGLCFVPLNCSEATPYVGISNDIMNPYYQSNSIISSVSIANLVDLGYYSVSGEVAGEGDFTPSYNSVQSQSLGNQRKILGRCSKSIK